MKSFTRFHAFAPSRNKSIESGWRDCFGTESQPLRFALVPTETRSSIDATLRATVSKRTHDFHATRRGYSHLLPRTLTQHVTKESLTATKQQTILTQLLTPSTPLNQVTVQTHTHTHTHTQHFPQQDGEQLIPSGVSNGRHRRAIPAACPDRCGTEAAAELQSSYRQDEFAGVKLFSAYNIALHTRYAGCTLLPPRLQTEYL
jgi:hypothetical protein